LRNGIDWVQYLVHLLFNLSVEFVKLMLWTLVGRKQVIALTKTRSNFLFTSMPIPVLIHVLYLPLTTVPGASVAGVRRPCNGCKRRLHLQIK
jgi:hypothetical protein